jgi:hypothetical protein
MSPEPRKQGSNFWAANAVLGSGAPRTSPTLCFIFKHAEIGSSGNFLRSQVANLEETEGVQRYGHMFWFSK